MSLNSVRRAVFSFSNLSLLIFICCSYQSIKLFRVCALSSNNFYPIPFKPFFWHSKTSTCSLSNACSFVSLFFHLLFLHRYCCVLLSLSNGSKTFWVVQCDLFPQLHESLLLLYSCFVWFHLFVMLFFYTVLFHRIFVFQFAQLFSVFFFNSLKMTLADLLMLQMKLHDLFMGILG